MNVRPIGVSTGVMALKVIVQTPGLPPTMVPPIHEMEEVPGTSIQVPPLQPALAVRLTGLARTIWNPPVFDTGKLSVKLMPDTAPADQLLRVTVNVVGCPGATEVGDRLLATVKLELTVSVADTDGLRKLPGFCTASAAMVLV